MANVLKMAKKQAIIGLLESGWSQRRIARELGVNRETVGRYAKLKESKPAIVTPGLESLKSSKPAIVTPGQQRVNTGRKSQCEPFLEVINNKVELGLSAQRIYQDLCVDHGFDGSYSSVKRYVRRLDNSIALPFRRIEVEPGQEAQVDFGTGAWIIECGKKRRPYVFRITLSHSRKSYSEPVFRQTTENFIRAIENAFRHFGGVPKTLVIDNLRAAVKKADWFDPELNPKVLDFAKHYHIAILPTKPYMPRHKGKIESGIKYVKNNALKGRTFNSLVEQATFLIRWENNVADTRIHGTTKKQVRELFNVVERPTLQPLPKQPFPFYHEGRRKVHRDAHIEIDKSYYSVPPEYLGSQVWVRWDSRLIRIFNNQFEQIALHSKMRPGKFSTDYAHILDKKISGVELGVQWLLGKVSQIGPQSLLWAKAMIENRGIEGVRVLQGFVALTKRYSPNQIEQASLIACKANQFRLRPLRELLKCLEDKSQTEFLEHHEIIRPLSHYQELLFDITQQTFKEEIPS